MMSDKDESVDMELRETLQRWNAPGASAALDNRMLANYRRLRQPDPLWRRIFTATVPVPAPLAALVVLALILSLAVAFRARDTQSRITSDSQTPLVIVHTGGPQAVLTPTKLVGFQPLRELKLQVIKKGERREN